jgi:hypothetical protein
MGSKSVQYVVPFVVSSLKAVELAFHVRKNPASSGIKELPPAVWLSVTRNTREPKVGSTTTELAGPRCGAGLGLGFGSVPVYAAYVEGAN